MERDNNLGKLGKDKVTGFVGVITGYAQYLTGCDGYCLSPKAKEDGTVADSRWVDTGRVEKNESADDRYKNLENALKFLEIVWKNDIKLIPGNDQEIILCCFKHKIKPVVKEGNLFPGAKELSEELIRKVLNEIKIVQEGARVAVKYNSSVVLNLGFDYLVVAESLFKESLGVL